MKVRSGLPCCRRRRRRLPCELVVEALPRPLDPALDDLSVPDSVDVDRDELHHLSRRCEAEVLTRVRALARDAVSHEVALCQHELDTRTDIGEPAADRAEHLLE